MAPIVESADLSSLSDDEIVSIVDSLLDELSDNGLNDDNEPTRYGLIIDDLAGRVVTLRPGFNRE